MKIVLIAFLFIMCQHLIGQPFEVGKATIVCKDPSRGNRRISVNIYYPSENKEAEGAFAEIAGKCPVVCFGHGFVMDVNSYSFIWKTLVPEGIIVALPKKERGIHPSHPDLAKDISFIVNYLQELGKTESSLFYNHVDNKSCAMGHSMGGGAAVLAAALNPGIDCLVTMAPAETKPSAVAAASGIALPALVISGSDDCVTRPEEHQLPIFRALMSQNKTFISIKGGTHCYMADDNRLCKLAESTCNKKTLITRETQHAIINRYLIQWLGFQLKSDPEAGSIFNRTLLSDKEIEFLDQ